MKSKENSRKILLLNPPGKYPYTRDYFCSKISKSLYLEPPIDLLILSGILQDHFEVVVIDSIVNGMGDEECRKAILSNDFPAVISLTSGISWKEDALFLQSLKKERDLKILGIGDVLLREVILEELPWMDGILMDFTTPDVVRYLSGDYDLVQNMIFRQNGKIVTRERSRKEQRYSIPIPRHDLFLHKRYGHPFLKRQPFTILLTDYGCPFSCPFCINSRRAMGFKIRPIENVLAELQTIRKLGIEELFIRDQTFAWDKERAFDLCNELENFNPLFSWFCFSRVDVVHDEILKKMRRAGCHSIIFGVESGDAEILHRYKPGINLEIIKNAFSLCGKFDIQTIATFMIGLPGETRKNIERTIHFSKEIDPDIASFNIYVPKVGTLTGHDLFKQPQSEYTFRLDQSGYLHPDALDSPGSKEIYDLHRLAIRNFYFRSHYFFKALKRAQSIFELRNLLKNGIKLFFSLFFLQNFIQPLQRHFDDRKQ